VKSVGQRPERVDAQIGAAAAVPSCSSGRFGCAMLARCQALTRTDILGSGSSNGFSAVDAFDGTVQCVGELPWA